MADISNKTLAILVGIALVVSVIGIFGPGFTGKATTAQGTAYIYPLGALAISIVDNSIDFLNGTIDNTGCTIDSWDGSRTSGCQGTTWLSTKDVFIINNTGTVNSSVKIKASKDAATWLGGTSPSQQYRVGAGNCASGPESTYAELGTSDSDLCDQLNVGEILEVPMKVTLADNANTGQQTNTITFTAYQI